MKFLLSLSLLFILVAPNIKKVRQSYIAAAKSEVAAQKFAKLVESVNKEDSDKLLVAYKGCALTLKSKHSNYLPDKISFMKEGAGYLDHAAESEPQNIEIRMIRMSVQENVPFIVNYRDKIEDDKAAILANFAKSPKDVRAHVGAYIKLSDSFSKEEKARYK